MYNFRQTYAFKSARYPGITANVRSLTVERRAVLDMAIAADPARQKYYDALIDRQEIKGDTRPEQLARAKLNESILSMERQQRVGPYMRICVESVAGFETEEGPGTPETLASSAPSDLCDELMSFIDFDMRLSAVEEKNSSPSSASSGPTPAGTGKYNCVECKKQHWHRQRNCPLYFPDQPKTRYQWVATVEIKGQKATIDKTESDVCPRSVCTPQITALIPILSDMRNIPNATLHGPNLAQWPAKFADVWGAMDLYLKAEKNAIEHAYSRVK